MATDYSIAAKIDPPKIDPLALISQVQATKNAMTQGQILQQGLQSKILGGKLLAGSIDPETGLPDQKRLGAAIVADPSMAPYAGEALTAAQGLNTGQLANQGTTLENQQKDLALSQQRWKVAAGVIDSLQASKEPMTADTVVNAVKTQMIPLGHFNDQHSMGQVVQFVQGMPQPTGNPAADDKAIRAYLQQQSIRADSALEHINANLGTPTQTDTGPAVAITRTSPLTGQVQSVGAIQKGLSPGEAVSPNFTTIDANGVPSVVTKGATAEAAKSGAVPKGIVTGPAAGTIEAQAKTKAASADQFTADVNDAGGFAQRMQGLTNAEKALKGAQTGKGGQALQDWRAVLGTLGVPISDADKAKAVNFDEAKKYLTDYANRRGAALGMGTDAGREMIHAANPSVDINKAAATDILKVIKGLERMQNAQVAVAEDQGIQPGDYSTWRAGWNRTTDPRGFMADQIPAAQRVKLFDGLSKPEQAKYAKGVKAAIDAGYFTADDLRK